MITELIQLLAAFVQAFLTVSTWALILAMYWDDRNPPTVIWGVAVVMVGTYGITIVGPKLVAFIRGEKPTK
jgi:hypothetical protein